MWLLFSKFLHVSHSTNSASQSPGKGLQGYMVWYLWSISYPPLLTLLQSHWTHCFSNTNSIVTSLDLCTICPLWQEHSSLWHHMTHSLTFFKPCSTVTISTGNPVQPIWNYIAPPLLTLPAPACPILFVLHSTHHLLTFYIVYIFTMFIASLPH